MIPADFLSFFDPATVMGLAIVGLLMGMTVLSHMPTSLQLGPWISLFLLTLADILPWTAIIGFRAIRNLQDPHVWPNWYLSIGTLLMFLTFDVFAAAGILVADRLTVLRARRDTRLPHGVHAVRVKHDDE